MIVLLNKIFLQFVTYIAYQMSLEVSMILGEKCVSLPVTPNEQPLNHIITTYS